MLALTLISFDDFVDEGAVLPVGAEALAAFDNSLISVAGAIILASLGSTLFHSPRRSALIYMDLALRMSRSGVTFAWNP